MKLLVIALSMLAACGTDTLEEEIRAQWQRIIEEEISKHIEEGVEEEEVSQQPLPPVEGSCGASGFTKIQASIKSICMNCHNEAKGGLTAAFDATTAQTNIDLLQAAGWTDGGELHNYVIGETKHGGATHSGATNSDVKDIPRTDYTPWCAEDWL